MIEYMFSHSFWGLCAWDLPALLVLILMILIFALHREKMKERERVQGQENHTLQRGSEKL